MFQPGKGESLSSLWFARDMTEYTGDTKCSVQRGVGSLGVGTLSSSVLARSGQKRFLGVAWVGARDTIHFIGVDTDPPRPCLRRSSRVLCGDIQLLDLLSYLLGWGATRGTTCFFLIRE
ncbi:hypothetical protein L1987_06267 [Smallanthus sonchifolius]|uniref:Uncharacterized protein n=1 Tax=Smallanthus sonchifolius TaxID=185202 RepID=A0ACB9JXN0_9ASTR|nr:hypothetical protein L1987_06267 [Smallanthus sonchifolius]